MAFTQGLPALEDVGEKAFASFQGRLAMAGAFPQLRVIQAQAFQVAGNEQSEVAFSQGLPALEDFRWQVFNQFRGQLTVTGVFPRLRSIKSEAFASHGRGNAQSKVAFEEGLPALEGVDGRAFNGFAGSVVFGGAYPQFRRCTRVTPTVLLAAPEHVPLSKALVATGDARQWAKATCVPDYEFYKHEGDVTLTNLVHLQDIGENAFALFQGRLAMTGTFPRLQAIHNNAFLSGNYDCDLSDDKTKVAFDQGLPALQDIGENAFRYFKGRLIVTGSFPLLRAIPKQAFFYSGACTGGDRVAFGQGLPMLEDVGENAFEAFRGTIVFGGAYYPNLRGCLQNTGLKVSVCPTTHPTCTAAQRLQNAEAPGGGTCAACPGGECPAVKYRAGARSCSCSQQPTCPVGNVLMGASPTKRGTCEASTTTTTTATTATATATVMTTTTDGVANTATATTVANAAAATTMFSALASAPASVSTPASPSTTSTNSIVATAPATSPTVLPPSNEATRGSANRFAAGGSAPLPGSSGSGGGGGGSNAGVIAGVLVGVVVLLSAAVVLFLGRRSWRNRKDATLRRHTQGRVLRGTCLPLQHTGNAGQGSIATVYNTAFDVGAPQHEHAEPEAGCIPGGGGAPGSAVACNGTAGVAVHAEPGELNCQPDCVEDRLMKGTRGQAPAYESTRTTVAPGPTYESTLTTADQGPAYESTLTTATCTQGMAPLYASTLTTPAARTPRRHSTKAAHTGPIDGMTLANGWKNSSSTSA